MRPVFPTNLQVENEQSTISVKLETGTLLCHLKGEKNKVRLVFNCQSRTVELRSLTEAFDHLKMGLFIKLD